MEATEYCRCTWARINRGSASLSPLPRKKRYNPRMSKHPRPVKTVSLDELSGRTGTYVLIIELNKTCKISVGALGVISFDGGYYAYVGSARGPGGLRARLRRHLSRPKKRRWHIDFLLHRARPRSAVVFLSGTREDSLAALLRSFLSSVEGFGAFDDPTSGSHLFYLGDNPSEAVRRMVGFAGSTPGCRIAMFHLENLAQSPREEHSKQR